MKKALDNNSEILPAPAVIDKMWHRAWRFRHMIVKKASKGKYPRANEWFVRHKIHTQTDILFQKPIE
jgi:hypothetical protein